VIKDETTYPESYTNTSPTKKRKIRIINESGTHTKLTDLIPMKVTNYVRIRYICESTESYADTKHEQILIYQRKWQMRVHTVTRVTSNEQWRREPSGGLGIKFLTGPLPPDPKLCITFNGFDS
jgi:hypothetical protein